MKMLILICTLLCGSDVFATGYVGSSFAEVWSVVQDEEFQPVTDVERKEYSLYQDGGLPIYPVNSRTVFAGGREPLERDAKRTVSERFDYYDRIPKRLHPNGVCVAGVWKTTERTPYSGMLATGAEGLFIGRISVTMGETLVGEKRGFGFAGKIFPTLHPHQSVVTGNFFTIDVLLGTFEEHALSVSLTNQPETGFQFNMIGLGLKIGAAFLSADKNPGFRPLTQMADAGRDDGGSLKQPKWMRLRPQEGIILNDQEDFRNEVLQAIKDNREIKYDVEISDVTSNRKASRGWVKIGEIVLDQAKTSYGCDRRLHFAHPKL